MRNSKSHTVCYLMTRCINPDIDISEMPHPNVFREAPWYPHAKPARHVPSTQTPHIVMSSSNKRHTQPDQPYICIRAHKSYDEMAWITLPSIVSLSTSPLGTEGVSLANVIWDGSILGTRHGHVRRVELDVDVKQLQGFVNRVVNIACTSEIVFDQKMWEGNVHRITPPGILDC